MLGLPCPGARCRLRGRAVGLCRCPHQLLSAHGVFVGLFPAWCADLARSFPAGSGGRERTAPWNCPNKGAEREFREPSSGAGLHTARLGGAWLSCPQSVSSSDRSLVLRCLLSDRGDPLPPASIQPWDQGSSQTPTLVTSSRAGAGPGQGLSLPASPPSCPLGETPKRATPLQVSPGIYSWKEKKVPEGGPQTLDAPHQKSQTRWQFLGTQSPEPLGGSW